MDLEEEVKLFAKWWHAYHRGKFTEWTGEGRDYENPAMPPVKEQLTKESFERNKAQNRTAFETFLFAVLFTGFEQGRKYEREYLLKEIKK